MSEKNNQVTIIGGGLSGCEAAFYLARLGVNVTLYERRLIDYRRSPAHHSAKLGELVCSSSLKNLALDNASGVLKQEMKMLNSLVLMAAEESQIPAGTALAVDRERFSDYLEQQLRTFPNLKIVGDEIEEIPSGIVIIATGPLTDGKMLAAIEKIAGAKLHFYDASAPLIEADSINLDIAYYKNRYQEVDGGDYLNCPFDEQQFDHFYQELINAATIIDAPTNQKEYFSACQPIEVMARQGRRTLTFGSLKPKGLEQNGKRHFAVAQLRQDNVAATLYSLVGFQTNLTYQEQKRVFRLIPGLERAEFARFGLMHRNSYLSSPTALLPSLNLVKEPRLFIAGQLNGVEGYLESAVTGIICAINAHRMLDGKELLTIPEQTITGGLIKYITNCDSKHFQPINANWGLVKVNKKEKGNFHLESRHNLQAWINEYEIFGRI